MTAIQVAAIKMKTKRDRYYVVWIGRTPGVYSTWQEAQRNTRGYANSKHKAFPSRQKADEALRDGPEKHLIRSKSIRQSMLKVVCGPIPESLCVDAAFDPVSKSFQYRGVSLHDESLVFFEGPFWDSTNNITEFLAIVHALRFLAAERLAWPVYSPSRIARGWVRDGQVRSEAMNLGKTSSHINHLVTEAIGWLDDNEPNQVRKWEKTFWGKSPADYGRK